MLVSRQLLEAKALVVGDVVRLSAEETGDGARPFRIVGVYEPTPDPLRITGRRLEARLHLPDLIDLTADPADPLSAESVTSMNGALVDPADRLAFARDLDARVPAVNSRRTVRPLGPSEPFVVIERFHLAISIVTLIGSTMFLLALMVVRVEERRETAGVLRLRGVPRRRVILNILAEGVLIALRLEVDVENVAMTRMDREGVGAGLDLYQLRACFHVAGRVGGRTIDFTAPGSAETFRGR